VSRFSEKLITKKELAKRLSYSTRSIERWVQAGMPCHRFRHGGIRFDYDEVLGWLEGMDL